MARRKPAKRPEKGILFCPKCNSIDISTDFSNAGAVDLSLLQAKVCNRCGFAATVFPAAPLKEIPKLKSIDKVAKRDFVNRTTIKGVYVYYLIGILAAAIILVALIVLSLVSRQ